VGDHERLEQFIDRYPPTLAQTARVALKKMRARLPGAMQLVYDNYNALVIGFASSERPSDAVFSIAVYPRWVTLFFLDGAELDDPEGRLQGSGNQVRSIRLDDRAATLDDAYVRALMAQALKLAGTTMRSGPRNQVIVRSASKKQRPRRPSERRV
jgi:DNA helicase HerA-like ATPase